MKPVIVFSYLLSTTLFFSCQHFENKTKRVNNFSNTTHGRSKSLTASRPTQIQTSTIHFFADCDELMSNTEVGGLMGINKDNDSTGYLCFADCYDCKDPYEIIFVYKGGISEREKIGYEGISKEFHNGCANKFENFNCFAFVNPMRDPDKQKDEHAMNIDFPITLKIYKRTTEDNWKFLRSLRVNTFEEYQIVRFNTIYDL